MTKYGGEIYLTKNELLQEFSNKLSLPLGDYSDVDLSMVNTQDVIIFKMNNGQSEQIPAMFLWEFLKRKHVPKQSDMYLFNDVEKREEFYIIQFLASDTDHPLCWHEKIFFK